MKQHWQILVIVTTLKILFKPCCRHLLPPNVEESHPICSGWSGVFQRFQDMKNHTLALWWSFPMSLLSIKAMRGDEDWGTDALRGKMWVAAKACYHLKMASMQWMASTWVPSFPVSCAGSWLYLPNQQTLLGAFVRCFVGDCPFVASSGHKNSVSTVELSATLGRADFFASSIQGPGQAKVGAP